MAKQYCWYCESNIYW